MPQALMKEAECVNKRPHVIRYQGSPLVPSADHIDVAFGAVAIKELPVAFYTVSIA